VLQMAISESEVSANQKQGQPRVELGLEAGQALPFAKLLGLEISRGRIQQMEDNAREGYPNITNPEKQKDAVIKDSLLVGMLAALKSPVRGEVLQGSLIINGQGGGVRRIK
jgi:hypothetical protein